MHVLSKQQFRSYESRFITLNKTYMITSCNMILHVCFRDKKDNFISREIIPLLSLHTPNFFIFYFVDCHIYGLFIKFKEYFPLFGLIYKS